MPNHLSTCTSPYLLQHQHNPVDWYPWCEEALERSRAEDKPIFLSIGYSACHWCHVMEHESFENEEIASYLNKHFICIKVDREERPDLDHVYMAAVQMMTGRGGWPLSVFLTPDLQPFYGGTYWPPESRFGLPGFLQVLQSVVAAWQERREQAEEMAQQLTSQLNSIEHPELKQWKLLDEEQWAAAADEIAGHADDQHGGFGGAPKFPQPMLLHALLRDYMRRESERSLAIVNHTLDRMYRGGIYDHLGGGFARYSVDAQWLVPHFEKMLYDNAQLAAVYLHAYQVTGRQEFREVTTATLDYLIDDMQLPGGGFAASEDADSEGEEGKFYVWQLDEINAALGQDAARFAAAFGVSEAGNWEGKNILHLPHPIRELAHEWGCTETEAREWLARACRRLRDVRDQRVRPARDDKVLVCWNALAIAALAETASALGETKYLQAAERAAGFIREAMTDDQHPLYHNWLGEVGVPAFADDYAALIDALVSLYQATGNASWVSWALKLAQTLEAGFADTDNGGFYYTHSDQSDAWIRPKPVTDSSIPSANCLAATALARLGTLLGDSHWLDLAVGAARTTFPYLQRAPLAVGQALVALDWLIGPTRLAVLPHARSDVEQAIPGFAEPYYPRTLFAFGQPDGESAGPLESVLSGKVAQTDLTLYACELGRCDAPLIGAEAIREWLVTQSCHSSQAR